MMSARLNAGLTLNLARALPAAITAVSSAGNGRRNVGPAVLKTRRCRHSTTGVTMPETIRTLVPVTLIGLGMRRLIFPAIMPWRSRRQDRRWPHESRMHQCVSEFLAQEYEQLLTPEERQRREAQRRHIEELRARAEAELAAEASQRGGRRRG
jgi:hypothetical protein